MSVDLDDMVIWFIVGNLLSGLLVLLDSNFMSIFIPDSYCVTPFDASFISIGD
jgi:hypothetical protein